MVASLKVRSRRPLFSPIRREPSHALLPLSVSSKLRQNGLASGLSAGCVKLVLAPFDTVKTLQQHSRSLDGEKALTLGAAARELLKRGGVGELYSGVAVTVLGSMPSVGLYFGVYHFCKKKGAEYLERNDAASAPLAKTANIALAAAIGNTVASFTRVPYEVVKQKVRALSFPLSNVQKCNKPENQKPNLLSSLSLFTQPSRSSKRDSTRPLCRP